MVEYLELPRERVPRPLSGEWRAFPYGTVPFSPKAVPFGTGPPEEVAFPESAPPVMVFAVPALSSISERGWRLDCGGGA